MAFKKDTTKVQTFSAGPIKKTGFYQCTITKCYDKKSQVPVSESAAIHFEVVTNSGQYASFDLWWKAKNGLLTDKNGKDLPALQSINDLQVLLDIDDLSSKPGRVAIYDFDLRQDVEQKKMVYTDLVGQQIGIILEAKQQPKNIQVEGKWVASNEMKTVMEFMQFFDVETKQSAAEFLSNSDAVSCDRYLNLLLEDEHIIKQASNQPNAPVVDPISTADVIDMLDEDIPF